MPRRCGSPARERQETCHRWRGPPHTRPASPARGSGRRPPRATRSELNPSRVANTTASGPPTTGIAATTASVAFPATCPLPDRRGGASSSSSHAPMRSMFAPGADGAAEETLRRGPRPVAPRSHHETDRMPPRHAPRADAVSVVTTSGPIPFHYGSLIRKTRRPRRRAGRRDGSRVSRLLLRHASGGPQCLPDRPGLSHQRMGKDGLCDINGEVAPSRNPYGTVRE